MANIWKMFSDLIPDDPVLIGTVLTQTPDGYSTLETPGGGIVKAKGVTVAIGNKAFIQGGEVRGEAPDLPFYEVTV